MKQIILFLFLSLTVYLNAQDDIYAKYNNQTWRNNPIFDSKIDPVQIDYSLLNAAVFFRTNEMRVKNGLSPVKYHLTLEKSATIHADDMVSYGFFSHTNSKNISRKTPTDRAKLAGIKNPFIAENIANNFAIEYKAGSRVQVIDAEKGLFKYPNEENNIGYHSYITFAEALVDQWMNSEGHRANILNKDSRQLGVGTTFYQDKKFNNIPKIMAVQNFQFFEIITE